MEQKKLSRAELRRQARTATVQLPIPGWLTQALEWPVYESFVAQDWNAADGRKIATILFARIGPTKQVAGMSVLLDLACVGVKEVAIRRFKSIAAYEAELRSVIMDLQPMDEVSPDLLAKIMDAGVEYARGLGFEPQREYPLARTLLGAADPQHCPTEIHVGGPNGKPFYITGPYDNIPQIIAQLEQRCGPDGFEVFYNDFSGM